MAGSTGRRQCPSKADIGAGTQILTPMQMPILPSSEKPMITKPQIQSPTDNFKLSLLNLSSSTSTLNSSSSSAVTSVASSTSTTPQIFSNGKISDHSFKDLEYIRSSNSTLNDLEEDEEDQTDSTVIHYISHENFNNINYISSDEKFTSDIDLKEFEYKYKYDDTTVDLTNSFEIITEKNISIDNLIDTYMKTIIQSESELNEEIRLSFEEFKFDIITDHLSVPMDSKFGQPNNNINEMERNVRNNEIKETGDSIHIKLSTTPYLLLIHSIRPKMMSFSLICFIRKNFKKLSIKNILSLLILSISILNMTNNANIGIKLYSNMLINRTEKLMNLLLELEKYFFNANLTRNNFKRRRNLTDNHNNMNNISKLNLISSSIHLLISVIVKRIGKMIGYVSDIGCLWKYIIVYGLNADLEEVKVVKNVIENQSACSCVWFNEPIRLIRTLQYVRKVLLCVIMSSMEMVDVDDNDKQKAHIFMKQFWSKFGFDNIKWNIGKVTFATRLLGMSTCLDELIVFIDSLKNEIIGEDNKLGSLVNNDFTDEYDNNKDGNNIFGLDIVNERNEDERINDLSQMVEKIAYKLDLIELGIDNGEGLAILKNDINGLVSRYNEVTSGKSPMPINRKKNDNMELKKLRMSEILLEEFNDITEVDEKNRRRSSGLNIKLFSVVKDNNEEKEKDAKQLACSEIVTNQNEDVSEFKKTLERLCSKQGKVQPRPKSDDSSQDFITPRNKIDEDAFQQFTKELKSRIEEERNVYNI